MLLEWGGIFNKNYIHTIQAVTYNTIYSLNRNTLIPLNIYFVTLPQRWFLEFQF